MLHGVAGRGEGEGEGHCTDPRFPVLQLQLLTETTVTDGINRLGNMMYERNLAEVAKEGEISTAANKLIKRHREELKELQDEARGLQKQLKESIDSTKKAGKELESGRPSFSISEVLCIIQIPKNSLSGQEL